LKYRYDLKKKGILNIHELVSTPTVMIKFLEINNIVKLK